MTAPLIGLATLARKAFHQEPLNPVSEQLLARLATDDNDANALLDLSTTLYLSGQSALAMAMQSEALNTQRCFRLSNTLGLPVEKTLRVLAFMVPGDLTRNTAIEFLTEGQPITVDLLYLFDGAALPETLPEHDIAFVAICESAANRSTLEHLAALTQNWPRPLINPASTIAAMSRDVTSRLLQDLPKIRMPLSVKLNRSDLVELASNLTRQDEDVWPLIVRPIDSHKGEGLSRVSRPPELTGYLAQQHNQQFFIAPFVDYRSTDGLYRKYRVLLIDGEPWICHLCMSENWMQHYMSAGMAEDTPLGANKRAEEARCFAEFRQPGGFADRHAAAFEHIYQTIQLPYIGLDCSELANGDLLIFEVDCGMTVHNMDDPTRFPYKSPQMSAVFEAFYQMLRRHSGQTA